MSISLTILILRAGHHTRVPFYRSPEVTRRLQIGPFSSDYCSLDMHSSFCKAIPTYLIDFPFLSGSWEPLPRSREVLAGRESSLRFDRFPASPPAQSIGNRSVIRHTYCIAIGSSRPPQRFSNRPSAISASAFAAPFRSLTRRFHAQRSSTHSKCSIWESLRLPLCFS